MHKVGGMSEEVRMTLRMPRAAALFLDAEAGENFTSRNAEVIRCIRERMKMKGAAEAATSPRPEHAQTVEVQSND